MIKIKKTIEFFQETCKCGKIIQGPTEKEVIWNLKIHKQSKECKKKK